MLAGLMLLLPGRFAQAADKLTALDRYVSTPDSAYQYKLVNTVKRDGYRVFFLEMTSQRWLDEKLVDQPLWKHRLVIVRPDELKSSTGLLLISGGDNGQRTRASVDPTLVHLAIGTGSVASELDQVPNQPLVFAGESDGRVEDGIIAYTWDKFLRTGDEKWPARLPMTKAAVRAMDTITDFCKSAAGGGAAVDHFVVAGASKRGWTTWTTAAVDKRVIGIVPIVIDTLNLSKTADHQLAAYGFWAPAVKDYTDMHLFRWRDTPQFRALLQIEDPYSYRRRYTMPKLLLNATGDQYFLPDNSQFYFDDLPGVKYLRYVPNTDHSLRHSNAADTVAAFYAALLGQKPLPRFSWTAEKDGSLAVTALDRPSAVKLWQATNPDARDFRLETLGPKWTATELKDTGGGHYLARVNPPAKGWTAFMAELTFPTDQGPPLTFTTQVRVVPDVLPHKQEPRTATERSND